MDNDEFYDPYTQFKIDNESNFMKLSITKQKAELVRKKIYVLEECIDITHIPNEHLALRRLGGGMFIEEMLHSKEEMQIEKSEKLEIGNYFNYDKKSYDVNPEVFQQIYIEMHLAVGIAIRRNEDTRKKLIEQTVALETNKKDALSELKKQRKKYLKEYLTLFEKEIFLMESIKTFATRFPDIKDIVIKRRIVHTPELIILYIFGYYLGNHELTKLWTESITKERTVMLYNEKIEELSAEIEFKNSSKSIVVKANNPLSELIFKEDGEEVFNYIVSKYPKKKTKAFFSYLFFFIKKINKSNIEGNDSVDYRQYILEEFGIKFPRIIYSLSTKQPTKDKINILFDNYFFEYNLLKMNEK
jgi:hypothetical protein